MRPISRSYMNFYKVVRKVSIRLRHGMSVDVVPPHHLILKLHPLVCV